MGADRAISAIRELQPDCDILEAGDLQIVLRSPALGLAHVKAYEEDALSHLELGWTLSGSSPRFVAEKPLGISADGVLLVQSRRRPAAVRVNPEREGVAQGGESFPASYFVGRAARVARGLYRDQHGQEPIRCLVKTLLGWRATGPEYRRHRSYVRACQLFLSQYEDMVAHDCVPTVAHGDLIPLNVIVHGNSLYLVDFEFAHLGCIYTDLGKWLAQGRYIGCKPTESLVDMISAIFRGCGERLSVRAITGAALAWLADYRWVVTAERRGRPDMLHYEDTDLERLRASGMSDQVAALAELDL